MATVTIDGTDYEVYADVAAADLYLKADAQYVTSWAAKSADQKAISLVSATRVIDRQRWEGTKTGGSAQVPAFPRTGLDDRYGAPVDSGAVPQDVVDATIVLAAAISEDPDVQEAGGTGSNVRRVKADTVEVEFFKVTPGARFTTVVQELLGQFLAGSAVLQLPFVSGTDVCSETPSASTYGLTRSNP